MGTLTAYIFAGDIHINLLKRLLQLATARATIPYFLAL